MELLSPAFAIFIIKFTISVLPGVFGIALLSFSEDKKRSLHESVGRKIFGTSEAISFIGFERALIIVGLLSLFLSALVVYFLYGRSFFS